MPLKTAQSRAILANGSTPSDQWTGLEGRPPEVPGQLLQVSYCNLCLAANTLLGHSLFPAVCLFVRFFLGGVDQYGANHPRQPPLPPCDLPTPVVEDLSLSPDGHLFA